MRIDKYLWCIRVYKTRNLATTACRKGQIKVNDEAVKPSREVLPGDKISVRRDQIQFSYLVKDIPDTRIAAKWVSIYADDQTPTDELERMKQVRQTAQYYQSLGTGRPTKKDRRDLEKFTQIDDDESER